MRQITAVVRDGGGISEFYAQLYSSVAAQPPLIGLADEHPMRWQAPEHRDVVTDPIDRMGYFALLGTLVDGTLAKWDRASMACSLEVRVPFLDHRVVELAWRLPPPLKYGKEGGSKRLLRRLLYRHVPPELVDRPKKGFSSPLPVWLRGPLREWAEGLLDEGHLKEEGLFEPTAVRECWKQHLAAAGDHWQLLWNVLMFQQWRSCWEADHDRQGHPEGPLMSDCFSHAAHQSPVAHSQPRGRSAVGLAISPVELGSSGKPSSGELRCRGISRAIPQLRTERAPSLVGQGAATGAERGRAAGGRPKEHRRVAIPYDKLAASYLAFVHLAAVSTAL